MDGSKTYVHRSGPLLAAVEHSLGIWDVPAGRVFEITFATALYEEPSKWAVLPLTENRTETGVGEDALLDGETCGAPVRWISRYSSWGSPSSPCAGNKLIENLDCVVWYVDSENKPLRGDLDGEGEKRTARHFTPGESDDWVDFGFGDKAEFQSIG